MVNSQWVVDVTAETFQEQVIAQSHVRPVVIDFWAPWCGPCRALGPQLEALAVEKDGGFLLAKVNTDDDQQLAQVFQVDGIPAVFGIRNGKIINQFTGVIPNDELRVFIDGLSPTEAELKAGSALELEGRDPGAANVAYREMLATNPDDTAARVGLARVLLSSEGNEKEAKGLLAKGGFGDHATEATRLGIILQLRETPHSDGELATCQATANANPEDAKARLTLGSILAARGEYVAALDALLAGAEIDRPLGRGAIREMMVKLFDVIGPRSPEANDYRNRLRLLLY